MDTRPYKVLLRREDGSVDVVSDDKPLKFTISPDGALDGWVRLTGEPFDTSALEVVFDDADTLQLLDEAMKALEFYGRKSEYQKETRPVGNRRLVLRKGEVLQDEGKLARKTLRSLKTKMKGKQDV